MAAYGAFGLDGLAHYTLALRSEHTLMMSFTIWAEALTGLAPALCCAVFATRLLAARAAPAHRAASGQESFFNVYIALWAGACLL